MKKVLSITAITVVLTATVVVLVIQIPVVQDALIDRMVGRMLSAPAPAVADEASLNIIFCGTGGPLPDAERAGPCTLVVAGTDRFLVDSGTGGTQQLQQMRIQLGDLKGVFYTHLHSDHISGLGDVLLNSWAGGRRDSLVLYGPPGVEALGAGFEQAFAVDSQSRIDHHGEQIFDPSARAVATRVVEVPTRDDSVVVYQKGDLKVTAFRVTHEPLADAYGYLFEYKGRSVVFSGDTVKDNNMVRFGSDADLMVHEAMGMLNIDTMITALQAAGLEATATILEDASEVHTSPTEAAEIANQANVQLLVFNHIVPPMPLGMLEDRFMRGVSDIRANGVMLGHDGMLIRLPVDSDDVTVESLK